MSESIDSIKAQLWQKMSAKEYRDNFVAAHLSTGIAAQIQTLREDRGWTQKQLGEKASMTQARISLIEGPGYDNYTFSTLKRLAAAFDVAIIARFAQFSELATWTADLSPQKLAVPSFGDDAIPPLSENVTRRLAVADIGSDIRAATGLASGGIGGTESVSLGSALGQTYSALQGYVPRRHDFLPSLEEVKGREKEKVAA
jgi:transcriptional regulator with XRE-family HTH domain